MRTKTAEQSDKILNVAVRLFATNRFHEARMEDIAAAAGVGKGTLYRYFKDKEELYVALIERSSAQMEKRLEDAVQSEADPKTKLEALTTTIIEYFDNNPHAFDLIQHAEAIHRPNRPFPWKARALSIELTKEVFLEGQRAGLFRPGDPTVAVLLFLGGLRAIVRFGEKPRSPKLAESIVQCVLQGALRPDACPSTSTTNGRGRKLSAN